MDAACCNQPLTIPVSPIHPQPAYPGKGSAWHYSHQKQYHLLLRLVKTESVGDHQKNINFFIKSDAWLITTIHSAMGQVIAEVAKGNANILVIEVNQEQVEVLPNLAG